MKNLKTLDLSGNDFKTLPKSFTNLVNLQELFLNDEKNFVLDKNLMVLKNISSLKILHLENDSISELPNSFYKLNQIEVLYLNNNNFKSLPLELKNLKNLKYLDIHDNKSKFDIQELQKQGFGFKINF